MAGSDASRYTEVKLELVAVEKHLTAASKGRGFEGLTRRRAKDSLGVGLFLNIQNTVTNSSDMYKHFKNWSF